MRLIDAEELLEHIWRDKLDSRELIAHMVDYAPTIDKVWIVSYYDEGEAPVVTVFDNELAAVKCCNAFLQLGHHTKVNCDECQIYKTFTVNGK